jgi:hypothetical protein
MEFQTHTNRRRWLEVSNEGLDNAKFKLLGAQRQHAVQANTSERKKKNQGPIGYR